MLTFAAIGIGLLVVPVIARPAGADDPIVVSPDAAGWVDTEVVDRVPRRAMPAAKESARVCSQTKSDNAGGYATGDQFSSGAPPDPGPGGWVIRTCSDGSVDAAWVPRPSDAAALSPDRLAQRATSRLPLPLPVPRFDPSRPSSAGPSTLVNIPTWFWVDGWAPVRQETRAGSVWAEVVATPVEATWFPGDGSAPIRCQGPGRPWVSDEDSAGACRHTYLRSSASQPDLAYTARVTVVWKVTWRGSGGRVGTLPLMERQVSFPVAVAERQTVVTLRGGS